MNSNGKRTFLHLVMWCDLIWWTDTSDLVLSSSFENITVTSLVDLFEELKQARPAKNVLLPEHHFTFPYLIFMIVWKSNANNCNQCNHNHGNYIVFSLKDCNFDLRHNYTNQKRKVLTRNVICGNPVLTTLLNGFLKAREKYFAKLRNIINLGDNIVISKTLAMRPNHNCQTFQWTVFKYRFFGVATTVKVLCLWLW